MPGLYDRYKLSNSTVVPQFTGSAAGEALQVGAHLQGLYDTARSGAGDVMAAAQTLQSMNKDIPLRDEVMNKIKTDIDTMSSAKDWENYGEQVRGLGRMYAQRAAELSAPLKQLAEYQKKLEDQKDLTPEQRHILQMRSLHGYKGLKKGMNGRLEGSFSGVDPAENIDLTKWADGIMQGMKEFKGASSVAYADGQGYIVKRGSSTEYVSEARVQAALNEALKMDTKVQAFLGMEGENAGFVASRTPIDMVGDGPLKAEALRIAKQSGYAPEEVYGQLVQRATVNDLASSTSKYLRTKYAYSKSDSDMSLSGDSTWAHNDSKNKDMGLFGDLITDKGIDINKQFGSASDVEKSLKNAATGLQLANTKLSVAKNIIGKAIGVAPDKLTDQQINDYFVKNPTDLGKYKEILSEVETGKQSIAKFNQLKDEAMDAAIKGKNPGSSFNKVSTEAFTKFDKLIKSGNAPDFIKKAGIKNIVAVVDGGNNGVTDYITVRDQAGNEHQLPATSKEMKEIAQPFKGISWKDGWKELSNVRSNSITMPLLDHTTPDGQVTKAGAYAMRVKSILSAAPRALKFMDGLGNEVGSSTKSKAHEKIAAGQFKVNGIVKEGNKLSVKISVLDEKGTGSDPDTYKEYTVSGDSNLANKIAQYAKDAGIRDQDIRTYQFGTALMPGSGYETIMDLGSTGRLQVNDVSVGNRKGAPLYEIVPNIAGNGISYEVFKLNSNGQRISTDKTFDDAFDLGAWLSEQKEGKRTIERKGR